MSSAPINSSNRTYQSSHMQKDKCKWKKLLLSRKNASNKPFLDPINNPVPRPKSSTATATISSNYSSPTK